MFLKITGISKCRGPVSLSKLRITRVFCSVRMAEFVLKLGNSPKRTSHGVARDIIKLNSLRSPSPFLYLRGM